MKERPILFSGPMVRAILGGSKTQTRRVVKPQPSYHHGIQAMFGTSPDGFAFGTPGLWREVGPDYPDGPEDDRRCPYGAVGDRLIVKEAAWMWCEKRPNGTTETGRPKFLFVPLESAPVLYCADHPGNPGTSVVSPDTGNEWGWRKKLGRFLPRWASRITLEITGVRAERLQEISEEDAKAEGVTLMPTTELVERGGKVLEVGTHRVAFGWLWETINGKRPGCSWGSNPWVWCVSFRRIDA